jgi:hypothetical protein
VRAGGAVGEVGVQQVPPGGQVIRGGGQVRDDRVGVTGVAVGCACRGRAQDLRGTLQGQPGGCGPGADVSCWFPGGVERIGQRHVGEVAAQRRDQAVELLHDTVLGAVGQLAAERHCGGDVLARQAEELTEDRRHGSPLAISLQIRPAACAASWHAARSPGRSARAAALVSRSRSADAIAASTSAA